MKDQTPHILVVDDDQEILTLVHDLLVRHGFTVSTASDAASCRARLAEASVDLLLLDIMLPGQDGLTLCRDVRASTNLPVILVSALGEETDRVVGLEIGADDYVAKPFGARELVARIRAVLRRAQPPTAVEPPPVIGTGAILRFAGWHLDLDRRELRGDDGEPVALTAGEYGLLQVLAERAGRVLSRDQLLDYTRGRTADLFDRSVDIQISRLRRKIEPDPRDPVLIKTVRNGGYLFAATVARS